MARGLTSRVIRQFLLQKMSDHKTSADPSTEKDLGNGLSGEPHSTSPMGIAEPLPEWDLALQTWGWGWELHWIGFGMLFLLLALHALISLFEISGKKSRMNRGRLGMAVTSLLFTFGLTRALFFFINPYESVQCNLFPECPVVLTRILFAIALPCITASFSLVHLVFLQMTKLKLYPEKLQSGLFLFCIIAFHFSLALLAEVLVSLFASWKALSIICQGFYIAFNLILSASFIYSGTKIVRHVQQNHSHVSRLGNVSKSSKQMKGAPERRPYRANISKLVKITYIVVILGFTSCVLQLYSIFAVYDMYSGESRRPPKPWPWFIFQSLYRAVELVAGCTLAYVTPRQVFQRTFKLCQCLKRFRDTKENTASST